MKKLLIIFVLAILSSSCGSAFYLKENNSQTTGIDFSNGNWILGNIEATSDIKEEFTNAVLDDFSKHLASRLKYYADDKNLLIPASVLLKPSKQAINNLKNGTNYDYYINIKCEDREVKSDKDLIESTYYTVLMTYARVHMEVYDLNSGEIVFSQTVRGSYNNHSGMNPKAARKLIFGSYRKIFNEIESKS